MKMAVIYLLTNTVNGKRYVGKTVRGLEVRWQGHVGSSRRGDNDMLVCRAIKKHGHEAFERRVVEECDELVLGARETHWIHELHAHVSEGGYNLTFGGDGGLSGYKFSEVSREKIRQKALGRRHSEETKAKISLKKTGVKQSVEAVEKRARANRGKRRSEEQKARMKQGQLASGYRHSGETRAKIGIASSSRVVSDATREKLRQANTGRKLSDDVKRRISAAQSKPVIQLTLDGTVVREYTSIVQAANVSGVSLSSVQRSLYSGQPKRNFIWRYKEQ